MAEAQINTKEANKIMDKARELAQNPEKKKEMQAGWDKVCDILLPYYKAMKPLPRSFEVHHMNEHARYSFMSAYVNGYSMNECIERAIQKIKG